MSYRVILAFVAAILLLVSSAPSAQQGAQIGRPGLDPAAIAAAVERVLTRAPRGFEALFAPSQAGVRVLDVDVTKVSPALDRITIDLSQKAITYDPSGEAEALIDQILSSTAALTAGSREVEYRFLIEGLPLQQFLSRPVPVSSGRARGLRDGGQAVVSAGHGWYWNEASASWRLQRDYYWGIVEDVVNWDIANFVRNELVDAKLDVRPVRHPLRDDQVGQSGHPAWQESAQYFLRGLGAPPEVWNVGVDNYARDINSRPFYANWIDATVLISIHNNGGGGTGTETWYDNTNGYEAESRRLAEIINRRVVASIRALYDANWPDRGLRTCNGCHGENRLALRPAVILEVAFMDTKIPDNTALHSETFKQVVALGIREAIAEWEATQGAVSTFR